MIVLTKGYQDESIRFTSKINLGGNNFYYFKFTNRTTLDEVDCWIEPEGTATDRYELCLIDTLNLFADYPEGFWTYEIYPATVDELPTEPMLESGLMYLYPQTEYAPTKYDEQNNTFKVYNGQ
jgi:hypothetical protein